MQILLRSVFIFVVLIGTCDFAWSQNVCPKTFQEINSSCISAYPKPFTNLKIPLSRELEGRIYFFKTKSGSIGKIRIGSVSVEKYECTLYLDAVSYYGDQTFIPNSSISISATNQWLENRIYLDKEGLNALELKRGNAGCGIVFSKDVEAVFHLQQMQVAKYQENNILFYAPLVLIFIAIDILS